MECISPDHQSQIRQTLIELGFVHPETLVDRMEPCDDPRDPSVKSFIQYDLPREDAVDATVFMLIKEGNEKNWQVDELHISMQLESVRTDIGVVVVSRGYSCRDGPLPSKDQIQVQIENMVNSEKEKEAVFLSTVLGKELTSLGFDGSLEMLRAARHEKGFIILEFAERVNVSDRLQAIGVKYELIVSPPGEDHPVFLSMVRGSFVSLDPPNDTVPQVEQGFYKLNGQLPSKSKVLSELLKKAKLEGEPYEKVRQRFGIRDSSAPPRSRIKASQKGTGL